MKPGERLAQPDPFGPVARVPSGADSVIRIENVGPERRAVAEAFERLWSDEPDAAIAGFESASRMMVEIPVAEPHLGLGLAYLLKGDPRTAIQWISVPLEDTLIKNGARDPDPVEWAYFLIALLCLGKTRDAAWCAERYGSVSHPDLDRARWLVRTATAEAEPPNEPIPDGAHSSRATLHPLARCDVDQWVDRVGRMLRRSGRSALADVLRRSEHSSSAGPAER